LKAALFGVVSSSLFLGYIYRYFSGLSRLYEAGILKDVEPVTTICSFESVKDIVSEFGVL